MDLQAKLTSLLKEKEEYQEKIKHIEVLIIAAEALIGDEESKDPGMKEVPEHIRKGFYEHFKKINQIGNRINSLAKDMESSKVKQ